MAATLPCVIVLLLRNAYRSEESWSGRRALGDAAFLGLALASSQAAFVIAAPSLVLSVGWMVGGFAFTTIVMLLLRSGFELANTGTRPGASGPKDPVADFNAFRRNLRLRSTIETGALALLAGIAAWFGATADRLLVTIIAGGWGLATLLLVVHRLPRVGTESVSPATPRQQLLRHYVSELDRQREAKALIWWWYFAPLFLGIGFSTIAFGLMAQRPVAALVGLGAGLALIVLLVRVSARRQRLLEEKIAQLERCDRALPA